MRFPTTPYHIFIILFINVVVALAAPKYSCPDGKWPCDDGECIPNHLVCDGEVNCKDRSDETATNCIHEPCEDYAFRCAYGACVTGTFKCNKVKNCADNSDELEVLCGNSTAFDINIQGSCSQFQMQCENGKCLKPNRVCDGIPDCPEGRDESVEVCGATDCPEFGFRCGYGACIAGSSKCNGIEECADGSDEAPALCGNPRVFSATEPTKTEVELPLFSCRLPTDRSNIIYRNETSGERLLPGAIIPNYRTVKIECERGFSLVEQDVKKNAYFCFAGKLSEIPYCKKYCDNAYLFNDPSFYPKSCVLNKKAIPCDGPLEIGTKVKMDCSIEFYYDSLAGETELICGADVRWSGPFPKCKMHCGKVAPAITQFSRGGETVTARVVPWNVAIYRDGKYECSGSIIGPQLVLTAAHCFWDDANSKPFNPNMFVVTVGNVFKDFNRESYLQQFKIANITIEDYRGFRDNLRNDVAIVQVDNFIKFSDTVRPVCVKFESNERATIRADLEGAFTGWGVDDRDPTEHLQRVTMRTIVHYNCVDLLKSMGSQNYELADDKFCLKDDFGKTACRGDSGSGFVVFREDLGSRYFLTGVVSHAPLKVQDCAKNGIVTLTNVNYIPKELKSSVNNYLVKYV